MITFLMMQMDTLKKPMKLISGFYVFTPTEKNKEALKNTQNFGKKLKDKLK